MLLDPNGRITGINPYLEQVSGYSVKEVLGEYWFEVFGAEDQQSPVPELLHDVSGDAVDRHATKPIITKNGQERQIEWRGTTLSDADGMIVGYLNVGHDITEQMEHKKALQNAEQETNRARNAKSRFLETASNDLRHHLQTLSLLNGALRKVVTKPEAQKMFTMQADALVHLGDLLNSLLEISRLDLGDVELEITEISISEIFRRLQDEFESQAEEKALTLRFDAQNEVVYSDRALLTKIFRIMVSNAIRYTHSGYVNVYCRREVGGLRVTVEDSGIGIAPDQLVCIFDEFYQVKNDPTSRDGGLGLGLTIVEQSATLLGTNVEVASEPGKGSSFSLIVPDSDQTRHNGTDT
jgi:PAS domain S-box-containing protein